MKKITITLLTVLTIIITSYANEPDFCDGFIDGYREALDNNLKIMIIPICTITPIGINSNNYNAGYGMGYSRALMDIENEN